MNRTSLMIVMAVAMAGMMVLNLRLRSANAELARDLQDLTSSNAELMKADARLKTVCDQVRTEALELARQVECCAVPRR